MARELLEGGHAMSHGTPAMHPDVSDREQDGAAGFGARLRRERERQNLSIAAVAQRTKILGALIEGLENDDLSRWPCGFYRRGFFRAYVMAIGLDPEPLLREFLRRFPDPEDVAAAAAAAEAAPPRASNPTPLVRLTLAQEQSWFKRGRILRGVPLRCAVVAFDLVVLACIAVTVFAVLDMFWAPLAVASMLYYGGGVVVLGNTPGVFLYGASTVVTPTLPLVVVREGQPADEDPAWRVATESPIRV